MCNCTICKATDKFHGGFATWPKGELRPIPRKLADKGYAAHWTHCGAEFYRKPAALSGSPFPCTGTPQSDPRIGYHFPGGQVGKVRASATDKPWPRSSEHDPRPPATDDAAEYAATFAKSIHLT